MHWMVVFAKDLLIYAISLLTLMSLLTQFANGGTLCFSLCIGKDVLGLGS